MGAENGRFSRRFYLDWKNGPILGRNNEPFGRKKFSNFSFQLCTRNFVPLFFFWYVIPLIISTHCWLPQPYALKIRWKGGLQRNSCGQIISRKMRPVRLGDFLKQTDSPSYAKISWQSNGHVWVPVPEPCFPYIWEKAKVRVKVRKMVWNLMENIPLNKNPVNIKLIFRISK